MQIRIHEIQVKEGRRELSTTHVRELADSIRELGLLNPITIDKGHTLIAGLHRLEAVKLLAWTEIACTVSSLEGLQAELAEIDENFVRNDISALEFGDMMLRRKEIYEMLHPESKHGGDRKSEKIKTNKIRFDSAKSFVQDTAEKLGVVPRTVELQIQTAKNLTSEAKDIIKGSDTKITQKAALKLSRLQPEQQKEAATLLAAQEIKSVDEYTAAMAEPAPECAEPTEGMPEPIQAEDADPKLPEPAQDTTLLFTMPGKHFESVKAGVADLKDPNKDCSCTQDSFLAEITTYVRKFHREIEWYGTPYYEVIFPSLSSAQLDYLQQQMDSIGTAADHLINQIKRSAKT